MALDADQMRYELVRDAHRDERSRAQRIDSKTSVMMGVAGTLLTVFASLGTSSLSGVPKSNRLLPALGVTLLVGLGVFSITFFIFLFGFGGTRYRSDPNPTGIIGKYANASSNELIKQLTSNMSDAFETNRKINDSKALILKWGLVLLGGSVFVIFLFGVLLVTAYAI